MEPKGSDIQPNSLYVIEGVDLQALCDVRNFLASGAMDADEATSLSVLMEARIKRTYQRTCLYRVFLGMMKTNV